MDEFVFLRVVGWVDVTPPTCAIDTSDFLPVFRIAPVSSLDPHHEINEAPVVSPHPHRDPQRRTVVNGGVPLLRLTDLAVRRDIVSVLPIEFRLDVAPSILQRLAALFRPLLRHVVKPMGPVEAYLAPPVHRVGRI